MVALLNDWEVVQWLAIPPFPYRRADARFYVDHVRANHEAGPATEFAMPWRRATEWSAPSGSGRNPLPMRQSGTGWSAALGPWLRFGSGRGGGGLWFRQLGAAAA